nr:MAG TPA: hypothetical protein [Bacteriophage sp.]
MRNASRLGTPSLMPPVARMHPVFPRMHFPPIHLFDKCMHLPGQFRAGEETALFLRGERTLPPHGSSVRQTEGAISINHA